MRIPFRHGETVLHFAAQRNWTTLCRWLLRLGVNIERADILERTALHCAAQAGAADAARVLIDYGADLYANDWKKRTPLELAQAGRSNAAEQAIREAISLSDTRRTKALKVLRARKQT